MPRNPTWERDELMLALDLYFRVGTVSSEHPEVIELSRQLNQLALHPTRSSRFRDAVNRLDDSERSRLRNPNGVAMKLANFAALDPAYSSRALSRGGKRDAAVWREFANDRERLKQEVSLVRAQAADSVVMSRPIQYWAICANPDLYRVEDAVHEVTEDTWTTKGKPVQMGDRVIIWKAKGHDDWRGIVALGEVITDPAILPAAHGAYYAHDTDANQLEERVVIRFVRPPGLPLRMGGEATDVLRGLSVSKATGGTVFYVTPEQWDEVVDAAGGWPDDAQYEKDPYAELAALEKGQSSALYQVRDRRVSYIRPHSQAQLRKGTFASPDSVFAHIFSPTSLEDARRRTLRAIVQRQGQPRFRQELLEVYGRRCAITGCDAVEALEAAHIISYLGPQTNHPSNGLLLRADVHTLFDLGLIAIDSATMTVLIAPSLTGTTYGELAGRRLCLPPESKCYPSREALDKHREHAGL